MRQNQFYDRFRDQKVILMEVTMYGKFIFMIARYPWSIADKQDEIQSEVLTEYIRHTQEDTIQLKVHSKELDFEGEKIKTVFYSFKEESSMENTYNLYMGMLLLIGDNLPDESDSDEA